MKRKGRGLKEKNGGQEVNNKENKKESIRERGKEGRGKASRVKGGRRTTKRANEGVEDGE